MSRIITFSDGFSSATSPSVIGANQVNYDLLNNQTNTTLFSVNSTESRSCFYSFEITRSDSVGTFSEVGSFNLFYDGSNWDISIGLTNGDNILADAVSTPESLKLSITSSLGVGTLKYSSGNMGSGYSGKIRLIETRVKVL